MPATPKQVEPVDTVVISSGVSIKAFKAWKQSLLPEWPSIPQTFDRIFSFRTGFADLDQASGAFATGVSLNFSRFLTIRDIPLHTNASENDIRAFVIKRKISGGTMSHNGRLARDTMLGLMKTCRKLGVSFYHYLGDRLGPA